MANQVLVEELAVTMELKNNGIMLRVNNSEGKLRGYLQIARGGLKWFKGKEQSPSYEIPLDEFIKQAEA